MSALDTHVQDLTGDEQNSAQECVAQLQALGAMVMDEGSGFEGCWPSLALAYDRFFDFDNSEFDDLRALLQSVPKNFALGFDAQVFALLKNSDVDGWVRRFAKCWSGSDYSQDGIVLHALFQQLKSNGESSLLFRRLEFVLKEVKRFTFKRVLPNGTLLGHRLFPRYPGDERKGHLAYTNHYIGLFYELIYGAEFGLVVKFGLGWDRCKAALDAINCAAKSARLTKGVRRIQAATTLGQGPSAGGSSVGAMVPFKGTVVTIGSQGLGKSNSFAFPVRAHFRDVVFQLYHVACLLIFS
jgi:hypothetical protein